MALRHKQQIKKMYIICLAFSYLKVENKKVQNKNRPEGMKNLHANPDEQQI